MASRLDGLTLLLVDDEPTVRRSMRRLLQLEGATVVEAADADHAIQLISGGEPVIDAILLDFWLPGVSGAELITTLKNHRPELPLITITGEFGALPDSVGDVPLLQKPFDQDTLVETLRSVMSSRWGGTGEPRP